MARLDILTDKSEIIQQLNTFVEQADITSETDYASAKGFFKVVKDFLTASFINNDLVNEFRSAYELKITSVQRGGGDARTRFRSDRPKAKKFLILLIRELEGTFESAMPPAEVTESFEISHNKKVFVVHGHDEAVKEKVVNFLHALGMEPIVLANKASSGMTIIEKIEKYGDVGFAVVLMTPDDLGNDLTNAGEGVLEKRPRQNVIIEFGYFWGLLGRDRVCLLNSIGDNVSSDLKGLGYISLDKSSGWKIELGKELIAADYDINSNAIFH